MSFLKDRQWAVGDLPRLQTRSSTRSFIKKEPAAAGGGAAARAGAGGVRARAAAGGCARLGLLRRDAAGRRRPPAGRRALRGRLRGSPAPGRDAGHPRLRLATWGGAGVDLFPGLHPGPHLLARLRPDAPESPRSSWRGSPSASPTLRIAFPRGRLRLGRPYWMERMDDEYAKRAPEAPVAQEESRASTCASGNIYFFVRGGTSGCCPQAVKLIGENQIVYASDFPHWDHSWPASIDEIPPARRHQRHAEAERSWPRTPSGSTSSEPGAYPLIHGYPQN